MIEIDMYIKTTRVSRNVYWAVCPYCDWVSDDYEDGDHALTYEDLYEHMEDEHPEAEGVDEEDDSDDSPVVEEEKPKILIF